MELAAREPRSAADRALRLVLYFVWLALLIALASRHVFWRDEVRAFSIALQGDTVVDMLRGLHGEGHPVLWYLLLRGAHAVVPVREVLPAMAVLVDAAAMALLVFRSPFRPLVVALMLFGQWGLFEYGVMARNYGLAMLILFMLATLYPKHRDKGLLLGVLLATLCNTNVPAAFLAAAFLLFWLIELVSEEGLRWTRKHWIWAANAALAALGALLAFVEIYPTVHDAAAIQHPDGITAAAVLQTLSLPAVSFRDFAPWVLGWSGVVVAGLTMLLIGNLLGLRRSPGAFLASIAMLAVFALFFQLVYPGSYRHQALLLVWLVTMYWLILKGGGGKWPGSTGAVAPATGSAFFLLLAALQIPNSINLLALDMKGRPFSRSRDLGQLLAERHLGSAVLIADPDVVLEPIPYYAPNPIYLLRLQKFGHVVRFTRHARTDLSLDDLLADARTLQTRLHRPVVIVLRHRLDPAAPPKTVSEIFGNTFTTSPDQVRRFFAQTDQLARFAPAISDESYDVYLLRAGAVSRR